MAMPDAPNVRLTRGDTLCSDDGFHPVVGAGDACAKRTTDRGEAERAGAEVTGLELPAGCCRIDAWTQPAPPGAPASATPTAPADDPRAGRRTRLDGRRQTDRLSAQLHRGAFP